MKGPRETFEEIMLNPILSNRPKSIPEEDFLSEVFCLNTRIIGRYHCFEDLQIKGHPVDGSRLLQLQNCTIKRQEHVIARIDDTRGDTVDVETERNGVIRIDTDQWNRVKTKMRKGHGHDDV